MRCRKPVLLAAGILLLAACRSADADRPPVTSLTAGPGPSLRLLDSVILEENDSLYIGRPEVGLTVDDQGFIYVVDEFWNRVSRFRPNGEIDLVFGRAGSGPGEFRSTTVGTLVLDSLVIQPSGTHLNVFDRWTGEYRFSRRYHRGYLTGAARHGDRLIFALFDYATRRGIASIPAAELLRPDTGATPSVLAATLVPFASEYDEYPNLITFNSVTFAAWADTMLVGYTGVSYLVKYTADGAALDTIFVPARVRRGVSPEALEVFAPGRPVDYNEHLRAISSLRRIWRLPDGSFALWHQDNWAERLSNGESMPLGRAFVSLLSADLRSACLDTSVPFPGTEWPRLTVHGDTLLALDQVGSVSDPSRVVTVVRRYLIDDSNCEWQPTRH